MSARYFGARVARSEDRRFVTGTGQYVDDIVLPGMLHAAFVRSSHGHAAIRGIDTEAAKSMPGVEAVFTLDDLGEVFADKALPQVYPSPLIKQDVTQYPLAKDEVCFAGQTVALVVAKTRHLAEDAAAQVMVDYEPLPAVVDCRVSLKRDAPRVHADIKTNLVADLSAEYGDIDAAFQEAPHKLHCEFLEHRGGCHSMECRGLIATDSPSDQTMTLYSSAQSPYLVRRWLAEYLGRDETRVRVIAPDVGGGFGPKAGFYPEDVVIPIAAIILGCPVKWIEDRREHFTAINQQGDQMWQLDIAADGDGKVLGVRGNVICDMGAYANYGLLLPLTSLFPLPGPYAVPALDVKLSAVFTNTTSKSPVRGAGRPNAAYAMERVIETVARHLDMDPVEVRRVNFITKEQFPFQPGHKFVNGTPVTYDSGDFHALLDKALEVADYKGFKERQLAARAKGRYLGIGVSSCIEDTGFGPFEGVSVRVLETGRVLMETGAASQGQGHETVFAQIVADELGINIDDIDYHSADTGKFPYGVGTGASRVTANAGPAAFAAAVEVRAKALKMAANMLDVSESDLTIEDGVIKVKDDSARNISIPLGDVAGALVPRMGARMPEGFTPGLEATSYVGSSDVPHASGSNVAEVEVDIGTGEVRVVKYFAAHDCGRMINPMLVDGQIIGGVVHGIGNALFERMYYDEAGQPLSINYGEYLLPLATEMPPIEIVHQETPSPLNAIGVKGAGEGGTIPAANAIIAAIENALAPLGIVINDHPVDPQQICRLIDANTVS